MIPAGTKLGRYEIRSPLGAGGMGEVYRARDEKLNRDVAIKVLPTALSQDEDRFESPAWHEQALREAERAVKAGKARFSDWEEAKKRIRRKAAKLA